MHDRLCEDRISMETGTSFALSCIFTTGIFLFAPQYVYNSFYAFFIMISSVNAWVSFFGLPFSHVLKTFLLILYLLWVTSFVNLPVMQ